MADSPMTLSEHLAGQSASLPASHAPGVATVVGRYPDRVVLDAGSKVLGADRSAWATGFGRLLDHPHARITALSEHHATVTGFDAPRGTRVRVVPNHVCNAVNLADHYVVGDSTWPVDARGANT